jgi:CHAT domain-containing protein
MLAACLRQYTNRASRQVEKALAVGNPSYNPDLKLSDLPEAKREAEDIARLFGNQTVTLTGSDATEPAVCAAMRDRDVIHVASHSLVRENSPWLAAFALADGAPHDNSIPAGAGAARAGNGPHPSPGTTVVDHNDGLLYLDEVYRLTLPRTRLVVLSSCESALGQYYRGEGMVSLARPFLAAGVPTVVASLWPVDSAATAPLMVSFHRERKAVGNRSAEGLRASQTKMLGDPIHSHPYYWGAFMVVGAP